MLDNIRVFNVQQMQWLCDSWGSMWRLCKETLSGMQHNMCQLQSHRAPSLPRAVPGFWWKVIVLIETRTSLCYIFSVCQSLCAIELTAASALILVETKVVTTHQPWLLNKQWNWRKTAHRWVYWCSILGIAFSRSVRRRWCWQPIISNWGVGWSRSYWEVPLPPD